MKVSGRYTFDAPRQLVWDLMIDPTLVADCLPGCESLEPVPGEEGTYRATLTIGVAAVSGRYDGTVSIRDQQPPERYRMIFDGRGKAGFAKGEADVTLSEDGERTLVAVAGEGHVGGTVARVGQRLLGGVSKMLMDRLFACLHEKVRGKVNETPTP